MINQVFPKFLAKTLELHIEPRKAIKVGGWLALAVAIWLLREPLLALLQVVKDREAIVATVDQLGVWGPVILAATIFLQVVVAAIPGHLLIISAGYLYGFGKGFLLTWLTIILASQFTFYLARAAGKPLVYRLASPKLIEKWDRVARRQGIVFFIFSFNLPIFPTDIMSYVAGFSNISLPRFIVANVIGHIPVALALNLAGAYGFELSPGIIAGFAATGVIAFVIWLKYMDRIEAQFSSPKEDLS